MTTFYGRFPVAKRAPARVEISNPDVKARFAELNRALHGPPPTEQELREAHMAVHRQWRRDHGLVGLFE